MLKTKTALSLTAALYGTLALFGAANAELTFSDAYLGAPGAISQGELNSDPVSPYESRLSGFYVRGEHTTSVDSNFYDSRLAIEFEVLDQGWREFNRREAKVHLQNQIDLLQSHRQVRDRLFQSNSALLKLVRNKVRLEFAEKRISFFEDLLEQRKAQLESGAITQSELIKTEFDLSKARNDEKYYSGLSQAGLPPAYFTLANNLENLTLKDRFDIVSVATANSINLKYLQLMEDLTAFDPDYLDGASLRLFAEQRKNTRLFAESETLLGVRVRLPLTFDGDRDDKIGIQKAQIERELYAESNFIKEKADSLNNQYQDKLRTLANLLAEYDYLQKQYDISQQQLAANLDGLSYTPRNAINDTNYKRLVVEENILIERLEALDIVNQILLLSGIQSPSGVYQ